MIKISLGVVRKILKGWVRTRSADKFACPTVLNQSLSTKLTVGFCF